MESVKVIAFSLPPAVVAARHEGFFEEEGLDVSYAITRGSREQIRGLLAGTWDIAHTAADNVMAYNDREGTDLFVFLVADLGLSQQLFVAPRCGGYPDLRGQTLAVDALDSGYALVLRKMLETNGVPRGSYTLLSVGGTRQRLAALEQGQAAGCLLSPPYDVRALDLGYPMLQAAAELFPGYPGLTVATTRSWAGSHPGLPSRYARALLRGVTWAAEPARRQAVVEYMAEDQEIAPEEAGRQYAAAMSAVSKILPSPAEAAESLEMVRRLRQEITAQIQPLARYFDPEIMVQSAV